MMRDSLRVQMESEVASVVAFGVRTISCQRPVSSAVVVSAAIQEPIHPPFTETSVPGFAQPQMGTSVSRCRTMPSETTAGSESWAAAAGARDTERRPTRGRSASFMGIDGVRRDRGGAPL